MDERIVQATKGSTGLRVWRFSSIMSTAVSMSAAVGHLMELPGKMQYEPSLYVRLHRTLYPTFGKTAGIGEIVSVVSTVALAWWVRKRRPKSAALTLTAAGCLAGAHAIFWTLVHPANTTMMSWPLDSIPPEWKHWRDQWEYSHAARALLETAGLGALVMSVLKETPDQAEALY